MRSSTKPKVIVISGPTASGKSDLAIRLARKFNGEIISADSRQVYRGMDIGTGKVKRDISRETIDFSKKKSGYSPLSLSYSLPMEFYPSGIRHWLLDVASPKRQYSVAHFKRDAQRAIRDILRRGKLPIICGGTGFWIDTLVYDQSLPAVHPDRTLRAKLARLTAAQLYARLQELDPERAGSIDRHNPVRLIRALEIVLATGRPVPPQINGSSFEPFILGISVPPIALRRRIARRLGARLRRGMIAEVRRLHAAGVSWKRMETFGLEYRWVARFLQKKILRGGMREGLLRDIIAYSKRQLTWLRRNDGIIWIHGPAQALRLSKQFLRGSTS